MSLHYYAGMTEGELVGHVMALVNAGDASELSQVLALRLRTETKLRKDAEMRAQLAQDRIYRLEREIRELKILSGED
jgi:dsRNA-specific ribonuclease